MKFHMGDWEDAADHVKERLAAGAWRHGVKTWDAIKEAARYKRFPPELNGMWDRKWAKKNGDLSKYGLYYWFQSRFKNAYYTVFGGSGTAYRVRRFYSVPHGVAEGETDKQGRPRRGAKEGLWLRAEDLNPADVRWLVKRYGARAGDSQPTKRFLWTAAVRLDGRPDDTTVGDVIDDILDDL